MYDTLLSHLSHLSLNREGRWVTTDDFTTSFLHFFLFFTAFWDLANSRPVHSLLMSFHLLLCLPCLLPTLSLCLARWFWPGLMNGRHAHTPSVCVRRSSCYPIACWIFAQTSSFEAWSLYEMRSIMQEHLISMAGILLCKLPYQKTTTLKHLVLLCTRELMAWFSRPFVPKGLVPLH